MKNYVKPSIELTKFDVEDIITVSGVVTNIDNITAAGQSIYNAAVDTEDQVDNIIEFQW